MKISFFLSKGTSGRRSARSLLRRSIAWTSNKSSSSLRKRIMPKTLRIERSARLFTQHNFAWYSGQRLEWQKLLWQSATVTVLASFSIIRVTLLEWQSVIMTLLPIPEGVTVTANHCNTKPLTIQGKLSHSIGWFIPWLVEVLQLHPPEMLRAGYKLYYGLPLLWF